MDGASGTLLWQKTTLNSAFLSDEGWYTCITRDPRGGYGVAGFLESAGGVLAGKIDDSGEVQWQNQYAIYAPVWEAKDIAATRDGGFVFAAAKPDLWTFKVDATGVLEWCQALGPAVANEPLGTTGTWIDETASGDIVVASHFTKTFSPQDDVWVFRFDPQGKLRWERLLHWDEDDPAGLVATPDDGCVVAAVTTGLQGTRPWLVKLDADGDLDWQRSYAEPENGWCRGIDRLGSGDLVVAGISRSHGIRPPGEDLRVMRLGPDGRLAVPCRYGTEATGTIRSTSSPHSNVTGFLSEGSGVGARPVVTSVALLLGQPFRTVQCASNSAPWVDLGTGLAGGTGVPYLAGVGTLQGGAFTSFLASEAAPSAPAALVTGPTQVNAPFFGGVLVPSPDLVLPVLTDPNGRLQINGAWPAGVPAGLEMFLQLAVVDPGAIFGVAFSNAVQATAP